MDEDEDEIKHDFEDKDEFQMIYECSVHPDLPMFPHTGSCPQGGMEEHKEKFLQGESA